MTACSIHYITASRLFIYNPKMIGHSMPLLAYVDGQNVDVGRALLQLCNQSQERVLFDRYVRDRLDAMEQKINKFPEMMETSTSFQRQAEESTRDLRRSFQQFKNELLQNQGWRNRRKERPLDRQEHEEREKINRGGLVQSEITRLQQEIEKMERQIEQLSFTEEQRDLRETIYRDTQEQYQEDLKKAEEQGKHKERYVQDKICLQVFKIYESMRLLTKSQRNLRTKINKNMRKRLIRWNAAARAQGIMEVSEIPSERQNEVPMDIESEIINDPRRSEGEFSEEQERNLQKVTGRPK